MRHFTLTFLPDGKQVRVHSGASILEAAGLAGIILNTPCGGKGVCGKCSVILEPSQQEVAACQYRVDSDLTIAIPPTSRFFEHRILSQAIDAKSRVTPNIFHRYSSLPGEGGIFGIALDIGTTTIVAKLLDMQTGRDIATQSTLNPQIRFGDDVISRIAFGSTEDGLARLHGVICDCVNELVMKLSSGAGIGVDRIFELVAVGNTTMSHTFLKLPISQLGQAPYKAHALQAFDVLPSQLCLRMNAAGNVHVVENIAGFVGSDTVGVGLACDVEASGEPTLAIDIGTNGEVVLAANGRIVAASCAAGPAFEGARIGCGSRAAEGAIEAVVVADGDIDIDVIGDRPAHSICGSGLIDAVAAMLELGVVDTTGRFADYESLKSVFPRAASRLINHKGSPAFVLARDEDGKVAVQLTQRDVRELQLAKAAIRTGIKLLENKLGLADEEIKCVFLAGAFGNYIRPASAMRIGLLPDVSGEGIHSVGNAALAGAEMILLSSEWRKKAGELASRIEYVEIAHDPQFQAVFADSMLF